MADLKTNYVDDVLDTTKNQLRKYQQIQNDDGTVSFVDVTEYTQVGTSFGAKDINDTNAAINDVNRKLEAKIGYMDSQNGTKIINNNGSYIIQSNGYIRTYFDTSPGAVRVNNVTYIYFGSSIIMTFPPIPVKAGDIITAVGFNSNQSSISFVPEASSE